MKMNCAARNIKGVLTFRRENIAEIMPQIERIFNCETQAVAVHPALLTLLEHSGLPNGDHVLSEVELVRKEVQELNPQFTVRLRILTNLEIRALQKKKEQVNNRETNSIAQQHSKFRSRIHKADIVKKMANKRHNKRDK